MHHTPPALRALLLTGATNERPAANSIFRTVRGAVLAGVFGASLIAQQGPATPQPPKAAVRPVTDEYFGQRIVDPYRWMEEDNNPELLALMRAQNAYARAYLDRLPGYATLLQRSREVQTGDVKVQNVLRRGERYLYTKLQPGDNLSRLYVRDGLSGSERLLFDPAKESNDKKHVSIGDLGISDDGQYASFLVMGGGGEYGDLRFIDLTTGQDLPDRIEDTRWWAGSWAPDARSILYLRFQKLAPGAPAIDRAQKSTVYLHRFGTPTSADKPVFGYGLESRLPIAPEELSFASFIKGCPYVIAFVNTGVSPESDFYIARAADLDTGSVSWRKIALRADQVSDVVIHGDDLYLLSFNHAPRYRVLKTSAVRPDLTQAQVVLPASDAVVKQIGAAKDGLYVGTLEGGPHRIYRIDYASNRKEEVPIPRASSGEWRDTDLTQNGILLFLSTWTHGPAIYAWDPIAKKLSDTKLQPSSRIDMSAIEVETTKVPSYDGTRVPLVILGKKGFQRNKMNPMLLTGYGAYGIESTSPQFASSYLPWLEKGGLLAIAGVRGGGEYGEEWHLAGKMATKPNTWRDFISCAEYLVSQQYTSPAHLGAQGGSAGGILAGNALTERPDLFGAIVMNVAMTNLLRSETTANGVFNTAEFGSVKTEKGFHALRAMDAYHKVKDGVSYPAVLFQGGMNDPRVNPFFSAKMAARLQAASSSGKPVLLDFPEDMGHGIGTSQEQSSKLKADMYAFLSAQLSNLSREGEGR